MGKIKGSFASTYDRFVKRQTLLPPGLLELVKSLEADSIVEFACGTGTVACGLALEGFEIVGVDYSPDMLRVARAKARERKTNIRFVSGDIAKVRLNRKFDLVLCLGNTVPQFISPTALTGFLQNCRRHLKDGGHAIFQLLNYERILKNRPNTFAIDIDLDAVRFKQYRYRKGKIDFIVTVVDGAVIPPKITKSKIVLKPWKSRELGQLIRHAGFSDIAIYGNYSKDNYNLEANDLILVAKCEE